MPEIHSAVKVFMTTPSFFAVQDRPAHTAVHIGTPEVTYIENRVE